MTVGIAGVGDAELNSGCVSFHSSLTTREIHEPFKYRAFLSLREIRIAAKRMCPQRSREKDGCERRRGRERIGGATPNLEPFVTTANNQLEQDRSRRFARPWNTKDNRGTLFLRRLANIIVPLRYDPLF